MPPNIPPRPLPASSSPPLVLTLRSAALTSIGSYCTSRASWQRPIVFAPFIPSSSPPSALHPLSPRIGPGLGPWLIVIPKTNWPSFNSADKCKKLGPQKPGCLRSVCGATIQHNYTSFNNTEEPIRLQGGFLDCRIWASKLLASLLGSELLNMMHFPLQEESRGCLLFGLCFLLAQSHNMTSHIFWREN